MRYRTIGSLTSTALAALILAACGGDDGDDGGVGPPPNDDPLTVEKAPTNSGDAQTGVVGEVLANGLRIIITRASEPEAGVEVEWATPDGGSLDPSSSVSDAAGIATSSWTLGPEPGEQTATATVIDAQGSPVTFTATAQEAGEPPPPPPPPPQPGDVTVQVLGPPNNVFSPATVTIQAGETVQWVWPSGSQLHNVVPDDGEPARSGDLESGPAEYSFTFDTPGTYNYYCANHGGPGGFGMSGTVIVE